MLHEGQFLPVANAQLHFVAKKVDSPVWLIITHGVGEHLGRHGHLKNIFGKDFNLLFYDLRGHGKSTGRRTYIENFSIYYDDLEAIVSMLQTHYGMKRFILFGHSMGGLITCGHLQRQKDMACYPERVFLSSPAISIPSLMGALVKYAPIGFFERLSALPFSLELGGIIDLQKLSHAPDIYQSFMQDGLNCLKLHSKTIFELAIAMKKVFSRPLRLKSPCYCVYGTQDTIVDPSAIKHYFQTIERSVILKAFEGAYHEIHNESEEYRGDYFQYLKNSLLESLYQA